MNYLSIYINTVRIIIVALSVCHGFKRNYKVIISTAIVFALTFLPELLEKTFNVKLDLIGSFLYIAVIIMTVYLGSALKFYDKYYWWDKLVHFLSGIVFVSFGIAIIKTADRLSNFYVIFFAFTYSLAHQAIWEVLEYIADRVFHTDNQRWQKSNVSNNNNPKTPAQSAGLVDTMNDIILCIVGTTVSCVLWFFIL